MAIPKSTLEDTEFAKNHILQSNLDEKCKKSILRLLNAAVEATNGLSLEEKVQKVTEAIVGLVVTQIAFLDSIDKKIELANKEQCKTCKAMKMAEDAEEEKKREEIINAWKDANGYKDQKNDQPQQMSIIDTIKAILIKPYAWIFGSIVVFSPYTIDILKTVLEFFGK